MLLNKKTRTLKLTRGEMCKIRVALTAAMQSTDGESRAMWDGLRAKVIAQLDQQDAKDPDFQG